LTALIRHTTMPGMDRPRDSNGIEGPAESDRALIVLDMTLDRFVGDSAIPGAAGVVRFIQGELRYFRERGRLVVFATGEHDHVVIQELTPRSDEITLKKPAPSAFFGTSLDTTLRAHRVRRVTLVGLETHTSVLLTAADALSRGYEVVVPDPCVCSADPEAHAAALSLLRRFWPAAFSAARATPIAHRPSAAL
jgi:nicotinamidase-related amidase